MDEKEIIRQQQQEKKKEVKKYRQKTIGQGWRSKEDEHENHRWKTLASDHKYRKRSKCVENKIECSLGFPCTF